MSWSFSGVGKPAALKNAIDKAIDNYGPAGPHNQSRAEFEQAAPHLKGLLDAAHNEAAVSISASGHASFEGGKRTYASVDVTIKQLGQLYE